jgi:hypothetical protein
MSVKTAARLAKADGVSLHQSIATTAAGKVGAIETADEFLRLRAANAKPTDLMRFLRSALATKLAENDKQR